MQPKSNQDKSNRKTRPTPPSPIGTLTGSGTRSTPKTLNVQQPQSLFGPHFCFVAGTDLEVCMYMHIHAFICVSSFVCYCLFPVHRCNYFRRFGEGLGSRWNACGYEHARSSGRNSLRRLRQASGILDLVQT